MTLCIAFHAQDGLVALADGMTSYVASEHEPEKEPDLDTRKLVVSRSGQPWVLLLSGRSSFNRQCAADVAEGLMEEAEATWEGARSVEPLAEHFRSAFASLEVKSRSAADQPLEGILCGYPTGSIEESDGEVWGFRADAANTPSYRCTEVWTAIGDGYAASLANERLSELQHGPLWYRTAMSAYGEEAVWDLPVHRACEAAVQAVELIQSHETAGWGPRVGGQWTSAVLRPATTPEVRTHTHF